MDMLTLILVHLTTYNEVYTYTAYKGYWYNMANLKLYPNLNSLLLRVFGEF